MNIPDGYEFTYEGGVSQLVHVESQYGTATKVDVRTYPLETQQAWVDALVNYINR